MRIDTQTSEDRLWHNRPKTGCDIYFQNTLRISMMKMETTSPLTLNPVQVQTINCYQYELRHTDIILLQAQVNHETTT
jgi:hypothetical protein